MLSVHVIVSGFVQGVGYRQFVKRNAKNLGLTGWVTNLPDGRVEVLFQSDSGSEHEDKEIIKRMIKLCKKGPFLSEVENIIVEWKETDQKYDDFEVIA